MDDDGPRWDGRYLTAAAPVASPPELIAAHPELARSIPEVGRSLDVACGAGAVSLWLATRGLDVVALDASSVAIEHLHDAAAGHELAARISATVVDLDDGLAAGLDEFDLIVCQRFRDPRLYPVFVERLRIRGIAIITVLSAVGTGDTGRFHAPAGELAGAFDRADVEMIHADEGQGIASVMFRRI